MRLERRTGLSLIAASLVGALLLAGLPLPAAASATTLHLMSGSASVARTGGAPRAAADGETLAAGDQVTTGPDGHVILAFVDGSTLTIEPGTRIAIAELTSHPSSTVTRLEQTVGRTWSSVQPLTSTRSRYEIATPAVIASVRGTAFEVDVAADGASRVRTAEGAVSVANALGEVLVPAGTHTTATPSTPPAPPTTPAPSTQRTLEIGSAPIVVVDDAGRGCGRADGTVLQQIPGCVVSGGEIRIEGTSAESELTVMRDAGAPAVVVVTPRPVEPPTSEVTLPLIGPVPVQGARGTTAPITVTAVPTIAPTVTSTPTIRITPLPTIAPTSAPTLPPVPGLRLP